MPRKPVRSKRKAKSLELTPMTRFLLYASCRHHLEGSRSLTPAERATIEEMGLTPIEFYNLVQKELAERFDFKMARIQDKAIEADPDKIIKLKK